MRKESLLLVDNHCQVAASFHYYQKVAHTRGFLKECTCG